VFPLKYSGLSAVNVIVIEAELGVLPSVDDFTDLLPAPEHLDELRA